MIPTCLYCATDIDVKWWDDMNGNVHAICRCCHTARLQQGDQVRYNPVTGEILDSDKRRLEEIEAEVTRREAKARIQPTLEDLLRSQRVSQLTALLGPVCSLEGEDLTNFAEALYHCANTKPEIDDIMKAA